MKKLIKVFVFFLIVFQFTNLKAEVKPTLLRTVSLNNIVKSPSDVRFNPAGTKIFFSDYRSGANVLIQYDVDTPFNISTIDFDSKVTLATNGGVDNIQQPQGFEFNNDGTKVFAINNGGGFNAHLLSTPYDFSSATTIADDGFNFATDPDPDIGNNRSVKFNNDGTKMFLIDVWVNSSGRRIIEFNLSTPYDTSTVTEGNSFTISGATTILQDFSFDDDGTRMYVIETATSPGVRYIYVYKLSTGFDITTATFVGKVQQVFESLGSDGTNGTPLGMGFSEDGMKLYQVTYQDGAVGARDRVHEYDLSCPYGIVICEEDTVSNNSAQVDVAKQVIHQNSSVIFKRFDWLRRNEGNNNLNTNNINLNINNPILSALSDTLKNTFNQKYTKASVKKKKETRSNFKNLSFWSHGDISIGRTGDKATTTPQTLKVGGLMFGVDKKLKNNKFVGAALRYGQGNTHNKTTDGFKLDSETLTLNLYSTNQLDSKLNLNTLLGLSVIKIDQLNSSDQVTGNRNGKQLFTAINMNSDSGYGEFNIRPTGGFMFGITSLSSYTDFNTSSVQDIYDSLVFNTGNITAGLKFDKLVEKTDFNLFRNGSIEYIQDLSSNIGYTVKSHSDLTSQRKSVKRHSLHNLKVNFGMESVSESGHTFGLNFERLQGLDESSHLQSLFFKFGYLRENNTDIAFNFDPLTSNTANLSYLKHYNYFDLKLDTNYSFMDENPGYGLNLQLSNTF